MNTRAGHWSHKPDDKPAEDTAYHAPIKSVSPPFTFVHGPARAPRRRGWFDIRWVLVALIFIAACGASFRFFVHL